MGGADLIRPAIRNNIGELEKFLRNIEIAEKHGCSVPKLAVNAELAAGDELKIGSAFDAAIWWHENAIDHMRP